MSECTVLCCMDEILIEVGVIFFYLLCIDQANNLCKCINNWFILNMFEHWNWYYGGWFAICLHKILTIQHFFPKTRECTFVLTTCNWIGFYFFQRDTNWFLLFTDTSDDRIEPAARSEYVSAMQVGYNVFIPHFISND